jgi:cAMP-dependent protein kinase regulator
MTDDVASIDLADTAFAEGRPQDALRHYVALLNTDPDDLFALYRTALLLGRLGDPDTALEALDLAAQRIAESGQLLLALAAVQEIEQLKQGAGQERLQAVAALHGKGSEHVDRRRRSLPPPLPERSKASYDGGLDLDDPRLLKEAASDACAAAREHLAGGGLEADASLPFHPLFSDLEPDDLASIVPLMKLRVLPAGEVVIEQGAEGASIFILARGRVIVSRLPDKQDDGAEPTVLATLRSGAFFGELALLTNSPRAAQVVCDRPTLLFELDRGGLEELAGRSEHVAAVLGRYTRERLLRTLMATSPLFRPLDAARREGLIGLFQTLLFDPGQVVVSEGQPSEELYVVLMGTVQVTRSDGAEELTLAELSAGQIFGEISLIRQQPATATVRALEKAVLLSLSREAFNRHVADFPEVLALVYKVANERDATNRELTDSDVIAVDDALLLI